MSDDRLEELIGAWMRSSVPPEPAPRSSAATILDRLDVDRSSLMRMPASRPRAVAPHLRAAAAIAVVGIVASLLLVLVEGTGFTPDDSQPALVGASPDATLTPDPTTAAGPAIRWRSDEVDLRADAMRLHIGDRVYTGAGTSFTVEAENHEPGSWAISLRWREQDEDLRLRVSFEAREDRWWVGFQLVLPAAIAPDGTRYSGLVPLGNSSDRPGVLPLGEPWVAEWQESGSLERPTCAGFGFETLDVVLEFDGLWVEVHPQEQSALDQARPVLEDVNESVELADPTDAPDPVELSCPPVQLAKQRVGELDLVGVPVAEMVLRLVSDGFHDYDQPMRDVAVDDGGRVVVATEQGLWELGTAARLVETGGAMPNLARVDFASDGTMIIRGGERKTSKDVVALREVSGWNVLPRYSSEAPGGGPVHDLNDPVVAGDGSLYVGVPGGLGRFDGSAWSLVKRQRTSPLATDEFVGGFGPTKGLVVTSAGDPWMGIGHTVSELRDGRWIEHDPFAGLIDDALDGLADRRFRASLLDLGISPTDTLWAFVEVRPEERDHSTYALARFRHGAWSVYPLDDLLPNALPGALNVLVDDEGAVLLLVEPRPRNGVPRPDGAHLIRFDGETATELARLPSRLGYRLTAVGPGGTVWLIGGYPKERTFDRVHVVVPRSEPVVE